MNPEVKERTAQLLKRIAYYQEQVKQMAEFIVLCQEVLREDTKALRRAKYQLKTL